MKKLNEITNNPINNKQTFGSLNKIIEVVLIKFMIKKLLKNCLITAFNKKLNQIDITTNCYKLDTIKKVL